jgi:hypothetical protein
MFVFEELKRRSTLVTLFSRKCGVLKNELCQETRVPLNVLWPVSELVAVVYDLRFPTAAVVNVAINFLATCCTLVSCDSVFDPKYRCNTFLRNVVSHTTRRSIPDDDKISVKPVRDRAHRSTCSMFCG